MNRQTQCDAMWINTQYSFYLRKQSVFVRLGLVLSLSMHDWANESYLTKCHMNFIPIFVFFGVNRYKKSNDTSLILMRFEHYN